MCQCRQLQDGVHQRIDIGLGLTACTIQQGEGTDLAHHGLGFTAGDGQHPEAHVTQYLCIDAAQTEHDGQPKQRIVRDPQDHLDPARDHGLHQHPVDGGVWRMMLRIEKDLIVSLTHGIGIAKADAHTPRFGLVCNVG